MPLPALDLLARVDPPAGFTDIAGGFHALESMIAAVGVAARSLEA
jgi:hypothetical protein